MKHKLLSSLGIVAAVFTLFLMQTPDASAQGKITVSGVVVDETGEPMIGAGVLLKNTVIGVSTNFDGEYSLTIDAAGGGGVLVFSSIGYAEQEIPVNGRETINVQMQPATDLLEEVVVVGYGTQKRESVVGAISTVDVSNIKVPSAQLSTGLAGQLAGVVAVQKSGQPGSSSADFYIRGVSSFQGTSKPLVLVDGVERDLDLVDTDDIASFSILKDASASAVYGVRGANGVILITTKKGDVGRPKINIREETGITQPLIMPRFVNSEQFATMYNWAKSPEVQYTPEEIEMYRTHADPDLYPDVDWIDQMYRKMAHNQRVNVSVSGGTDVVRYFVSGSYFTESSIFKNAGNLYGYDSSISYDKFNFRANVDINLTESTILSLNIANIYETRVSPGTSSGNIWGWAFQTSPNAVPAEYSDGTISRPSGTNENPWNLLVHTGYYESFTNSAQSVIGLTQDFGKAWDTLQGLTANMKFSWDAWNYQSQGRTKTPTQYHASGRDDDGNLIFGDPIVSGSSSLSYSAGGSSSMNTYLEASLNYNRSFGDHRLGAMFLYNHSIKRTTLGGDATTSLPYKNQGIAGRVTYAFKDRYFAEINVGYNGSENFAPGHRFGFFPAFSAGYLISEEPFWAPIKNIANMFKFKGSYGKVGNDQIGGARWLYLPTIIGGNSATLGETGGNGGGGLAIGRPENLDFSWEEETKLNIGVEFELWHSLRIMADYFDSHRTGILMLRGGLPGIAGYQNSSKLPYVNVGETRNRGVDMTAEFHKQVGDWFFTARGNFTYNRNNLVNNDEPDWKYKYQNRIGKPYGIGAAQPWGLKAVGLFESEEEIANSPVQTFGEYRVGDIKYQDVNGDGRIDADDNIYMGYTTLPEITYGFGLNAEYKGFDINVFFQGVDHVSFFLSGPSLTSPFSSTSIERAAVQKDVWTNGWDRLTNHGEDMSRAGDAVYPRMAIGSAAGSSNNSQTSSWWQRDGSFLRLKNFEVGYSLPKKVLSRTGFIQSLRFYISGNNLLTFSKFKLWDPEQGGGQGASYPNNRVYSFGLNANF